MSARRDVSRSMVAFAVAMLAVLVLAGITWIPPLIGKDSGVNVTRPGLLTVDDAVTGTVDFPDGASVTLYASGLRLADAGGVLVDTVTRGARSPPSPATSLARAASAARISRPRSATSTSRSGS